VNWYIFSKTGTLSRRPACEMLELYWRAMYKKKLTPYKILIVKNVHFYETWHGF
jgi:hypothetical protein